METSSAQMTDRGEPAVRYAVSDGFVDLLSALDVTIALTTYQTGRLYLLSPHPQGGLMVNEQRFNRAMGVSVKDRRLYLATRDSVQRLENVLRTGEVMDGTFSTCFVPRSIHITGDLHLHDIGVCADGSIVFVNTRFNCVATLSERHSFRPVWMPYFISGLEDGDRCHLNGLAMRDGAPAYVTAVSRSDVRDGWRNDREEGGVVVDVDADEVVCEGLSMPHSPRWHNGRLWVLNSGRGELGFLDPDNTGRFRFHPVASCPGFLRGLAFVGDFAVVGLSKLRSNEFDDLPLTSELKAKGESPICAVQIIDIKTGQCHAWFSIDGLVTELYDVALIPSAGCACSIGPLNSDLQNLVTIE